MEASIRWNGAVRFEVETGSGATLTTDGPPESGGVGAGARPMELVLSGARSACSVQTQSVMSWRPFRMMCTTS